MKVSCFTWLITTQELEKDIFAYLLPQPEDEMTGIVIIINVPAGELTTRAYLVM